MDFATAIPEPFARLLPSAALLAYRIDIEADAIELVQVDRAFYRQAVFLDQRAFAGRRFDGLRTRLSLVAAGLPESIPPLGFLFHIGHTGSTLISRSLDGLPGVLGLREPLPLLALVAAADGLNTPLARWSAAQFQALTDTVRGLLARGFAATDRPLIKASSVVSVLAEQLLRPCDHALFLGLPLTRYLATLLRDPGLRTAARASTRPRLAEYLDRVGDDATRLYQLKDSEYIALSWLIDADRAGRLCSRQGNRGRMLLLDFETWLVDPAASLTQIATTFGLAHSGDQIERALRQAEPGRYAKDQQQVFDTHTRQRELELAQRQYADEIDQGRRFVERILTKHPGQFAPAWAV